MYKKFNCWLMHITSFLVILLIIPCAHSTPNEASFEELQKAAEQGDAKAQYTLGVSYAKGDGVTQDSNKAVEWYRKAAEQGYIAAQNSLGVLYVKGDGIAQDLTKAVELFQKAADQGNAEAQSALKKLAQCKIGPSN